MKYHRLGGLIKINVKNNALARLVSSEAVRKDLFQVSLLGV